MAPSSLTRMCQSQLVDVCQEWGASGPSPGAIGRMRVVI